MELLPLALVSGWACGVNTWLTVLVLGVLGRLAAFAEVPDALQRTDVLVVVGLLALVELVAEKVPFLGTAWDVVATVLRPVAGGVVGALLGGADGSVGTVVLAVVGALAALLSHGVTSVLRLATNRSGGPANTIAVAVAGDLAVGFAVVGAVLFPVVVAAVVLVVLVLTVLLTLRLRHRAAEGWRGFRRWLGSRLTGFRRRIPTRRGGDRDG